MTNYEKVIRQARREVSKITLEQQKQLLELYDDAIKDLSRKARKSKKDSLERRWVLDYNKELKKVKKELEKEINRQIKDSISKASKLGIEPQQMIINKILKLANIDTGDHFTSMFSQVQDNVVKDIILGNLYKDNKTLSDRIWSYGEDLEKDIQYTINQAILQKKSAIELAADLEKFVKEPAKRDTTWGRCYPNLKNKKVDYNAVRLARTAINHAYQTATIQSSHLNPYVEGIKWGSVEQHGRTCQDCIDNANEDKYGLGPGVFPKGQVPLDHPNGLCYMIPWIPKTLNDIADELRAWIDGEDNEMLDNWYNEYGEYFGKAIKGKPIEVKIIEKPREKIYRSTKEAFKRVAYINIDKEYAKEMDVELLDIINKYPLDSKGMTVKALKKRNVFGYKRYGISHNKRTGKLKLENEIVYSNLFHKNKEISTKYHIMNYKHRGSLLADSKKAHLATISHEYGHAIDTYYLLAKDKQLVEDIKNVNGTTLDWETVDLANSINRKLAGSKEKLSHVLWDRMQEEYRMGDREFHRKVYDELGSYAASEPEEFLAEGFANMFCLEERQKTEFIKKLEKMFNEEFDKVLRGGW